MTPLAAQVAKVDMLRNNLNDRCGKEDIKMAEKTDMQKDLDWYYANLRRLLPKYRGRVIAFADGNVIGDYDSEPVAVKGAMSSGYAPGTFAVHLCVPQKEEKPLWFTPLFINPHGVKI